MFSGNITLRPSSLTVACLTTKDCWVFAPYSIEERGEQDVPLIYLKEARWRTIRGSTRYFVNIPTRPSQYYPVEFNHNFVCWTEIVWDAPQNQWNIIRPVGPDYRSDIFEDEVQMAGQVGLIDGQLVPRTPAPSTNEEDRSEHSDDTEETGAPGNTTEEEGLANLAESIHINLPDMTTMVEPVREESTYIQREFTDEIDPDMGH